MIKHNKLGLSEHGIVRVTIMKMLCSLLINTVSEETSSDQVETVRSRQLAVRLS